MCLLGMAAVRVKRSKKATRESSAQWSVHMQLVTVGDEGDLTWTSIHWEEPQLAKLLALEAEHIQVLTMDDMC